MTKENKLIKFTSFVMLIAIIAMILVASTYAKYTSTASGTDTATVAQWDIKAGPEGSEVSITGSDATVAFNLFDTILDEDGTTENDVASGKIAPGTSGAFELSIKNDSQVNAEYTINFNISNTNLPLEFKINDSDWTSSLSNIATTALNMGTSDLANVEWRWAYEQTDGDATDTSLGINPEDIEITATLVVSQVD